MRVCTISSVVVAADEGAISIMNECDCLIGFKVGWCNAVTCAARCGAGDGRRWCYSLLQLVGGGSPLVASRF